MREERRDITKSFIIILFIVAITMRFASYYIPETKSNYKEFVILIDSVKYITEDEMLEMNAHIESRNRYDVVNRFGYMGKYQLGELALRDVGYSEKFIRKIKNSIKTVKGERVVNIKVFTPHKQKEAIKKYLDKHENHYLKDEIEKYVGRKINGVKITKAGILSASFLGFKKVREYLKSNGSKIPTDGNGHSIEDRMEVFSNYELKN